jgi:hypothetical protein
LEEDPFQDAEIDEVGELVAVQIGDCFPQRMCAQRSLPRSRCLDSFDREHARAWTQIQSRAGPRGSSERLTL